MQQGLKKDKISAVGDYTQSSYFSSREKLALTYADRITLSDQDVDDELFAKLREEFSEPAAIVELTAIVAFENFRSKFNHALQVEANRICQVKLSL